MTVKELKEKLEILIEENKGDYAVYILTFDEDTDIVKIVVNDGKKELYL